MTLQEWLLTIYPLLLNRAVTKVEHKLSTGETIKAYWVGAIIRIDIAP
jgi:hypothetical protein